jgi:drug/metabolite transporter (DMT)-like permease
MQPRRRAELFLLGTTLIWGGTFVIVKGGLDDSSPLLMLTVRFGAAALLLLPFAVGALRRTNAKGIARGAILGTLLFAGFAAQTIGLAHTTASKSGFITGMLVVMTPLFQFLIERRPPKLGNMIGVCFVIVGLFLLTSPEGSGFNFGDVLTVGCAICFSLYIVFLDLFTKLHEALLLTFVQIAVTALLSLGGAALFEDPFLLPTWDLFFALAYLTLLATLAALYVQTRFQQHTTPTRTAIIFSLEPVFSAVLAYLVRGEELGALGVAGGAIIVVGVLVSELSDILFRRWSRV